MIFKRKAIYKGTKYVRIEGEDYSGPKPYTRCEIYNCKYVRKYEENEHKCMWCNEVMKKTGAYKVSITFGYMPID